MHERMLSERLEPGESTILFADLHDGEVAEAQIPGGFPGTLIADGQDVPVPKGLRFGASIQEAYEHGPVGLVTPLTVKWRKRLEWYITNPGDEPVRMGLRYTVYDEAEVDRINREFQAVIQSADEPRRLRAALEAVLASEWIWEAHAVAKKALEGSE